MMSKELIFKTGKCKLRGFDYPVRIYATDGGASENFVHGAHKLGLAGWQPIIWDGYGKVIQGVNDVRLPRNKYDLIPEPDAFFFNVYTDEDGNKFTGAVYETREEAKEAYCGRGDEYFECFRYSDGVIIGVG